MPHTVLLPNMSFKVAKIDAVTITSRDTGLVTIGPTRMCEVADKDVGVDHEGLLPEHARVVGPHVAEARLLGLAGTLDHPARRRVGLQDEADVQSRSVSALVEAWESWRGTKRPWPGSPVVTRRRR